MLFTNDRPTMLFDLLCLWVRGVMVLDVGCEFHDWGSVPRECQIPRNVDLGQVNFTITSVASS